MTKGHRTRMKRGVVDIGKIALREFEERQRRGSIEAEQAMQQLPQEPRYNSNKQPLSKYYYQRDGYCGGGENGKC